MKKIGFRVLAGIVIIVILFSPYLLIDDFERNAPFVLMIWFLSVAYYLMMRKRVQFWLDEKSKEEKEE